MAVYQYMGYYWRPYYYRTNTKKHPRVKYIWQSTNTCSNTEQVINLDTDLMSKINRLQQ